MSTTQTGSRIRSLIVLSSSSSDPPTEITTKSITQASTAESTETTTTNTETMPWTTTTTTPRTTTTTTTPLTTTSSLVNQRSAYCVQDGVELLDDLKISPVRDKCFSFKKKFKSLFTKFPCYIPIKFKSLKDVWLRVKFSVLLRIVESGVTKYPSEVILKR